MSWNWIGQLGQFGAASPSLSIDARGAFQAFDRGDLDEAINLARQALASQPDNPETLVLLVRALIYRSYSDYDRDMDRRSALEISTEALSTFPSHLDVQAVHAFTLQANGQPVTAAETARRVLDQNPQHALARSALALGYTGVGSHEVSLRENLLAVETPGWEVDTLRALALSYNGVGDYTNALKTVEKAIALNGRLSHLHFERALYARQMGNADQATVAYFQILAYDTENVKARLRLCELSSLLRERDSAVSFCQQVTDLAPNWSDGWYQLGREYFLQGNFASAQQALNRCSSLQIIQDVEIQQRRFECWYMQGQAAEILGDCEGLTATYNEYRAMALDAGLTQTWTYPPEGPPMCAGSQPPAPFPTESF
jgi:tetratricopeptide (TPR) repeat protein